VAPWVIMPWVLALWVLPLGDAQAISFLDHLSMSSWRGTRGPVHEASFPRGRQSQQSQHGMLTILPICGPREGAVGFRRLRF
jgi:hypothetical protein